MVYAKNLHQNLWAEAVNAAAYAMNRTTNSKNSEIIPYELWHKRKTNVAHMKPFSTEAFALIPKIKRKKFKGKSKKAILVGYQDTSEKNDRICSVNRNKAFVADVVFNGIENDKVLMHINKLKIIKVNQTKSQRMEQPEVERLNMKSQWICLMKI